MSSDIVIPLQQPDSAVQADAESLLPRELYDGLTDLIAERLDSLKDMKKKGTLANIDACRAHEAILIDGARGTGKTTVARNLALFLDSGLPQSNPNKKEDKCACNVHAKDLLILDLVDPTLLEQGDNLFLNIIVAAINANRQVKNKLKEGGHEGYYRALQKIASALEDNQRAAKHDELYGIERLHAFVGAHGLLQAVHEYLSEVLELTKCELIIAPIDDVDMSLDHAFGTLEVVRKYLASPYVLPLVCGDLALYRKITHRHFHHLLLKDNRFDCRVAWEDAEELAVEYLRKVFPVPRRLRMPSIEKHLANDQIKVAMQDGMVPLPTLYQVICAALNGRVNGTEESLLKPPIPSVRALMHLLQNIRKPPQPRLPTDSDKDTKFDLVKAQRWWLQLGDDDRRLWLTELKTYFEWLPEDELAALQCDTALKWQPEKKDDLPPLRELPYFAPIRQAEWAQEESKHGEYDYASVCKEVYGEERNESLVPGFGGTKWIDDHWRTLQAYPAPEPISEVSRLLNPIVINNNKNIEFKVNENTCHEFFRRMLVHTNYYHPAKTVPLLFFGRFYELFFHCCRQEVKPDWLRELLNRPPFHSWLEVKPTKSIGNKKYPVYRDTGYRSPQMLPIDYKRTSKKKKEENKVSGKDDDPGIDSICTALNSWREKKLTGKNTSNSVVVGTRFAYEVMNKFFSSAISYHLNQAATDLNKDPESETELVMRLTRRALLMLWSALGSFEKGELFGLDGSIAYQNIFSEADNLQSMQESQIYRLNIHPFDTKNRNDLDLSLTAAMFDFPLIVWAGLSPK